MIFFVVLGIVIVAGILIFAAAALFVSGDKR